MKNLLLFAAVLLSISTVFAQEEIIYKNSIGFDVKPAIAVLFEGNTSYIEIDYERRLKNSNFRLKFNHSNGPFNGEIIDGRIIDADNSLIYESKYSATDGIIVSTGLAQRFQSGKISCYYGLDANFGINFGKSTSFIKDDNGPINSNVLIGTKLVTTYSIGVTPVVGTKLPLTKRLSIEIELGLPIVQYIGNINYFDENGAPAAKHYNFQRYEFNKLLNDFRLSFNF